VEERLETGSPPAHAIADVAGALNPQLVVLGSHGRRPLPRLLMGSVAESALLRIEQPVLVVPSQEKGEPELPTDRRWRIAVGVDLSNTTAAALDWVRELRAGVACDVVLIHLYWPIAEYTRFGQRGPRAFFEADPATVALLERSLAPHIGTLPGIGDTTLRILPSWGSLGERLIDEAKSEKADLLVLGTHHRHGLARLWHGSTVPGALHTAALPVVCVSRSPRPAASPPIPRLRAILAPTDLSQLGNRAIAHAYALARADRGVVHLLYVHERALPDPPYLYAPSSEGALTPGQEHELRARLLEQVPPEAAALGITTDVTIVDGGAPAEVICQTAERLGADAISLGSHGRGGLGQAVMGSVAARVLHHARIPVFVVRRAPTA
jgi:nucleotide-binding universal stress UspA family protein